MNGSGKEILVELLRDLSTRKVSTADLADATRRMRAALWAHGSTSEDSVEQGRRLVWASDGDGEPTRQGIALRHGPTFVTDVLETIFDMPGLAQHVLDRHAGLDATDYSATEWTIWLLVSCFQMFPELIAVERSGALDVERAVEVFSKHAAATAALSTRETD